MYISNISKILITYISKLINKNYYFEIFDNNLKNNVLTDKFINFIKLYYKHFLDSKKNINKYFNNGLLKNKYFYETKQFNKIAIIDEYINNKFIINDREKIIKIINFKKNIIINNLNITIFCENSSISIDNLIYNLVLIYKIILKLFGIKERKINLIIFYCDIKKFHNKSVISYENINSGYSYYNNIILFRKEEILKVFIHELLHILGLDNNYFNKNKKLSKIFKIKSKNLFNESYIEFLALILHTLYLVCNLNSNNLYSIIYYFNIFINYEIIFSLVQLIKFLNIYNLEFIDFFKNNSYNEDTNAFSYIYLKFLLIFKFNTFFDKILNYNKISVFNENDIIDYLNYLYKNNFLNFLSFITYNLKIYMNYNCKKISKIFCNNNRLSLMQIDL